MPRSIKALQTIAEQNRPFAAKSEGAEKGDRVTVSFQGTMAGEPFEGGSGEDVPMVLGSGQFIPGFEDQLIGIKTGESRTFDVTFPENYRRPPWPAKTRPLRSRQRRWKRPARSRSTTSFAKTLGLELLAKLRDALRERIEREHAGASRQKLKRALLDQLDELHKFEPPPSAGRGGIQQCLVDDRERPQAAGPHLCRRRNHRGEGPGRISRHRRAAGAAWARHCGNRREEQYQGDRRAVDAGRRGAGPT